MELLKKNIESLNPRFKVNIQPKEWSRILDDAGEGKEILITTAWAPDYADPDNFVHTFYASEGYYHPRANYVDPQIDGWIREARSTDDAQRRGELYANVARRALDQAYVIVMPSNPGIFPYSGKLKGISQDDFNPMLSFPAGARWKDLSKS